MKLLFALMLSGVVSSAIADDTASTVAARKSCADISARVSEISALEEPTEEETEELTKLKADYRRMCAKSARGRRTSADSRVVVESVGTISAQTESEPDPEEEEEMEEEVLEEVVLDEVPEVVEEVDPTVALEQELANLDAGLCADGSAPNKFGCCGDEVFKDLGDTVFACCPRDGGNGDCFPPLK